MMAFSSFDMTKTESAKQFKSSQDFIWVFFLSFFHDSYG